MAYQPIFEDYTQDNATLNQMIAYALAAIGTSQYGGNSIWNSPQTAGEWIPFQLTDSQSKWNQLGGDLTIGGVRNFVYFGHYNGDNLGGKSPGSVNLCINRTMLSTLLNNVPLGGNSYPQHPYRFVFIDGCASAKGDLCTYFGIPKEKNMTPADFQNKGPVRAYVGWKSVKTIKAAKRLNQLHVKYFERFWDLWPRINPKTGGPYTLQEALQDADKDASGKRVTRFYDDIVIYGFPDLIFWCNQ